MKNKIEKKNKLLTKFTYNPIQHPFHLVPASPGPYILAWSIFSIVVILILKIHGSSTAGAGCLILQTIYQSGRIGLVAALISGFWDIILEATYEGRHTKAVQKNIRFGFILFIVSEVIFFASFFVSYFYFALGPSAEIGAIWPPIGIKTIYPGGLPFVNTLILLSSGVTVTGAHLIISLPYKAPRGARKLYNLPRLWRFGYWLTSHDYREDPHKYIKKRPGIYNAREIIGIALLLTIILGLFFTYVQLHEYKHANFSIHTTVYGSLFYLITGFHGLHVIIGTCFLIICLLRHYYYHFTRDHHLGFELAIGYGHFVDIVWLFLFISLYGWGA